MSKNTTKDGAVLVSKRQIGATVVTPAPAAASSFVFEMPAGGVSVDEGAYSSRIVAVIDLGVQPPMAGSKSPPRRQIAVAFEIQNALSDGVEAAVLPVFYRRYNIVSGPKAELPKLVRAVLGRDATPGEKLEPAGWIGKPVTVVIEASTKPDGTTSSRVANVSRCTAKLAPMVATPLLYPGCPLALLPEWAATAIGSALTPTAAAGAAGALPADYDDDVA